MTASCSVCFCRHLALILLLSIYIVKSREYTYRMAIIPMTETIVIIGSGLAGLSAARRLQQAGHQALILDKGRRIGGRMSTRRAEGFLFNHGAQFVTARSERFKAVCQAAVDVGKLASWPLDGREQALSGTPAMRGLAEFMGQGLRIEQDVEVEHIICRADGLVHLSLSNKTPITCRHLLVTCPAPQTARLLATAAPRLAAAAAEVRYAPCWTVMAGFSAPLALPAAPVQTHTGIVGWATYEGSRPEANGHAALTLQANADYSTAHLEDPHEQICTALLAAFEAECEISLPATAYLSAHRWRYAKVERSCAEQDPFFSPHEGGSITVAGDWHPAEGEGNRRGTGTRAEDAFLSGERAASRLIETLVQ